MKIADFAGFIASASIGMQTAVPPPLRYDDQVILGASLSDTLCNANIATKVSLEQALQSAGSTGDACFAIDGFWHADGLFATRADALMTWSNIVPALRDRRLGVYGASRLMATAPKGTARYTLVGRLHHCDTAWPGATMVLGYCHHSGGLFVIISQAIRQRR